MCMGVEDAGAVEIVTAAVHNFEATDTSRHFPGFTQKINLEWAAALHGRSNSRCRCGAAERCSLRNGRGENECCKLQTIASKDSRNLP